MWFIVLIAIIVFVFLFLMKNDKANNKKSNGKKTATGEISPKRVMTVNEIHLYEKLKELLPNYTVFSQVSFSAFLSSKDYATRATFNRKMADFVILDQNYYIACLIELDDNSHRNREDQDRQRDEMCAKAGYKVIRFPSQPNVEQIKEKLDFLMKL